MKHACLNILGIFIVVIVLVTGCRKSNSSSEIPATGKSMDQLIISSGFNWATTKGVTFNLMAKDNLGQPIGNVRFDVYTALPDSGGMFLFTGNTDPQGLYSQLHSLPAYLTEVVITTNFIGLIRDIRVSLQGNSVQATFGGLTPAPVQVKSAMDDLGVEAGITWVYLAAYDALGVPANLLPINDVVDEALLKDLNATLPEKKSLFKTHPEFVAEDAPTNLELNQPADVWITYITEGAGWMNSIGYFTYNNGEPPVSTAQIDTVKIIFPNLSNTGSGGGLNPGNKVYLGRFPAGKTIGFVLVSHGWNGKGVYVGADVYYSVPTLNSDYASMKKHIILLRDINRSKFMFSFEDTKISQTSDLDFNDGILYLTATPVSAVNNTNMPSIITTLVDQDQDGVVDTFDEYPTDPLRAFNNYFPGQTAYGSLGFEDLWPGKGDYDFNDLVVSYRFNQVTNGANNVVEVKATLITEAMGAIYHNAFGFQMPVPANLVQSVSGSSILHGQITLNANGTETGQTKAVIIAYDDAYDRIPAQGSGVGANTEAGAPYVTPDTLNMSIIMSQPVTQLQLGSPPYNPFIILNGDRSLEVHLPDMAPTDKAAASAFGTMDDDSDPLQGRYYKTKTNLPWALNLSDKFYYVYERQPVNTGYLHFNEWAESSGILFPDWFKTTLNGYRDNAKIYAH